MTERTDIPTTAAALRDEVRTRYAARALTVLRADSQPGSEAACCGYDPISGDLYGQTEVASLPMAAVQASLGCGNPTALAQLAPGEVVLDLGSGGGIDVLLAAQRVGPTGFAYGLDMTDEMLALAEQNRAQQGATNAAFLKGEIEAIPLPDATVDVIISNCVVNLAADKGRVLREAYRVLKPGGRFAVSDVVVQGTLPSILRRDMEAWAGCVAGALEEQDYLALLQAAGFEAGSVEVTRVYDPAQLGGSCCGGDLVALSDLRRPRAATSGPSASLGEAEPAGRIVSAFVRARKPVGVDA